MEIPSVNASTVASTAISSGVGKEPGHWRHPVEKAHTAEGEAEADQSSQEPEHKTLQEELTGDLATGGPQGGADRDLLLTPLGPYEEEVGYVGARDQQDYPDRAQEHPQHVADVSYEVLL